MKLDPLFRKLPLNGEMSKNLVFGLELSRMAVFSGQAMSLPFFEFLFRGKSDFQPKEFQKNYQIALKDLIAFLKEDATNIANEVYPIDVLKTENPIRFWNRFPRIILDGIKISRRRDGKKSKDFGDQEKQYFDDLPEYYQRNFHFQTDGYLSEHSADLYEHQVEILFSGAADAMRRMMIAPLKQHLGEKELKSDGEGLHFLEIASGTGRLTRFIKLAFPKARVTCVDLSEPYLKYAQTNLKELRGINFIQGDAAKLPFLEAQFDAVFSCFLFHELPAAEREKIMKESHRVLKSGGFVGVLDSIQTGDFPDMDFALEQFPQRFHEPFYKNYSKNPVEKLFEPAGFTIPRAKRGFLSKVVWAQKMLSKT